MTDVRDRLSKILARVSSNNEAEALAALRAAKRLVSDHNLDWRDMCFEPHIKGPPAEEAFQDALDTPEVLERIRQENKNMAKLIMDDHDHLLADHEHDYLRNLRSKRQTNPRAEQKHINTIMGYITYIYRLQSEQKDNTKLKLPRRGKAPVFTLYTEW